MYERLLKVKYRDDDDDDDDDSDDDGAGALIACNDKII